MGRLIDADKLRNKLQAEIDKVNPPFDGVLGSIRCGVRLARNMVEDEPTVDAEPVVRCKDCRFYRFYDSTFGKGWMCFENNTARHGDDYCSRGERKDDVSDTNVGKMDGGDAE